MLFAGKYLPVFREPYLLTERIVLSDLRNVINTIVPLLPSFNGNIRCVLNAHELDIVARNAMILLVAFLVDSPADAVDTITHLWYSGLIKESHMKVLVVQVLDLS